MEDLPTLGMAPEAFVVIWRKIAALDNQVSMALERATEPEHRRTLYAKLRQMLEEVDDLFLSRPAVELHLLVQAVARRLSAG